MAETRHAKVIILGSGPAGCTAAVYAARADLNPVVIHGSQPGGQLTTTTEVENFPGFPDGLMGPQMMQQFQAQAERFGTEFVSGIVEKADLTQRPFKLGLQDGSEMTCDALIIATGASAKYLGLESEKKMLGYGVSACATCDGFFYRDKEIHVVGGGDTAMEEATFLTKFAKKVTIIHRRDELRASKPMQQRAFDNEKIDFLWNSTVTEVLGEPATGIKGLMIQDTRTGEEKKIFSQGMFLGIGHEPNTSLFKGVLEMDETGYLKVRAGSTWTNVEGVFACGDAMDHVYRQAITAAGTGCMAAIDAERWLEDQHP